MEPGYRRFPPIAYVLHLLLETAEGGGLHREAKGETQLLFQVQQKMLVNAYLNANN
jgi:hypothetical protein